jgi:hypothetical protein
VKVCCRYHHKTKVHYGSLQRAKLWFRDLRGPQTASPTVAPLKRGSIPISRSYDSCEEIPQKASPSPSNAWLPESTIQFSKEVRRSWWRATWATFETLPNWPYRFVPIYCAPGARHNYQDCFYHLLYRAIHGDCNFMPHLLLSALDSLFLTPSLFHVHCYF